MPLGEQPQVPGALCQQHLVREMSTAVPAMSKRLPGCMGPAQLGRDQPLGHSVLGSGAEAPSLGFCECLSVSHPESYACVPVPGTVSVTSPGERAFAGGVTDLKVGSPCLTLVGPSSHGRCPCQRQRESRVKTGGRGWRDEPQARERLAPQ